jgi:hypothetical protein
MAIMPRTNRCCFLRSCLFGCLGLLWGLSPLVAQAESRLFALLIGDTEARNVGTSIKKDLELVRATLQRVVAPQQLVLTEVSGTSLSRSGVEDALKTLRQDVRTSDAVFCYVATRSQQTLETLFLVSQTGERISRGYLQQQLQALKPRLLVMLSDPRNRHQPSDRHWPDLPDADPAEAVGRSLFLIPNGVIDLTSSHDAQGWATEELGGLYTRAWCEAIAGSPNVATTWKAVLNRTERLVTRLDSRVKQLKPAKGLVLEDLQDRSATRVRLGVNPKPSSRTGKPRVELEAVAPDGPAARLFRDGGRYRLVEGQHAISRFDGKQIKSVDDLEQAVEEAGALAKIEIVRLYPTEVTMIYDVELEGGLTGSLDTMFGAPWGLSLEPVDVSSGEPWMAVRGIVPGSAADNLTPGANQAGPATLVVGDRLRIVPQAGAPSPGLDDTPWNPAGQATLSIEVWGPDNQRFKSTLQR